MEALIIDRNTGSWNRTLVGELFLEPEATIICNIPLSRFGHNDKLIWRATTSGIFSVRSAYHLDISRKEQFQGEGSNPAKDEVIWKVIWHLNIPNSAHVFIWRACKNILCGPFSSQGRVKNILDQIWMEEVPNCIENVVTLEQTALSN